MQPTDDESKANFEIAKRPTTVQTKSQGRAKISDTPTIEIPDFVNSKGIEKGHVLFIYRAAKPKGGQQTRLRDGRGWELIFQSHP